MTWVVYFLIVRLIVMLRAGAMDNAEAMMKFVIKKALSDCKKDLEFCDKCYAVWKSFLGDDAATPPRRRAGAASMA
jgi:aspartyl/asparaginyl-tRNA synthetase